MENEQLDVVNRFVDSLHQAGVTHVCISPGSRSAPLTFAFARHPRIKVWTLLDERSAGYFALGLARSTAQPVVLVCTSGTATANYLPAVMEAHHSRVPLIILTADRPPELRGVGSNQTVDQVKLYGTFVKWYAEMPVPEYASDQTETTLNRHAAAAAGRLVAHAISTPSGPVHLNWPFREPLIPPQPNFDNESLVRTIELYSAVKMPSRAALCAVGEVIRSMRRGLIVCGPQFDKRLAKHLVEFAAKIQAPILADSLSQVRCGSHDLTLVVDQYDAILRDHRWFDAVKPDVIFRFGQTPTSKVLGKYLQMQTDARQIVVEDGEGWRDPQFTATHVIQADPVEFCRASAAEIERAEATEWTKFWLLANQQAADAVNRWAESIDSGQLSFEGGVFRELAGLLPAGGALVAGNSMPVRDLDTFYPKSPIPVQLFANRGVSGIDGVVSTAIGISAGTDGPAVLVIGDVSFYHDLNALFIASKYEIDLCVVLIHNDGGGIFSFLPHAAYPDTFEHFRTAHGVDFRSAVEMYGGKHTLVNNWRDFRIAVSEALSHKGLKVVEVRTDTSTNVRLHSEVSNQVISALDELFEQGGWMSGRLNWDERKPSEKKLGEGTGE